MAGMSGANDRRWALTKPKIFTFLSRHSGSDTLMLSIPKAMSPATMPVICVWPVVDHDLLAERLAHLVAEEPPEVIGGTARGEGNDQRDRARRIGLRGRHRGEESNERRRRDGSSHRARHVTPPDGA